MQPRMLAIDVGNTRIASGLFRGRRLVVAAAEPGDARWRSNWPAKPPEAAAMACVNSHHGKRVRRYLTERYDLRPVDLAPDLYPYARRVREPRAIGPDRLANAMAGHDVAGRRSCIVVDFGSAVTLDVVGGAGEFLGGAILPGTRSWTAGLAAVCQRLPDVAYAPEASPMGKDTRGAIRAGLVHGIPGMVSALLDATIRRLRKRPLLLATGGDARLYAGRVRPKMTLVPNLTLKGIRLWAEAIR